MVFPEPPEAGDSEQLGEGDGYLILHGANSTWRNVEGESYVFGQSLANGTKGLHPSQTVVCFRSAESTPSGQGRIFGIGRIGSRHPLPDNDAQIRYDRYKEIDPPLSFDEVGGDPQNNKTNSIVRAPAAFIAKVLEKVGLDSIDAAPLPRLIRPINTDDFDRTVGKAGAHLGAPELPPLKPASGLSLATVLRAAADLGLDFGGSQLVEQAVAAIRSGKHLLLQGPPGTGKSMFAQALASAAQLDGVARGRVELTGSSDWSPSDTVGTYRQNRERILEFVPGQILDSIATERWVVLDELNRADIDRAMGSLFSVLSGQAVVLPYEQEVLGTDRHEPVAIVPAGSTVDGHVNYVVHPSWRIIATMNTKDLDLLFEVSQAFMRRFAVLNVPCPPAVTHRSLLAAHATGVLDLDAVVARLVDLPGLELGPAITLDCARYAAQRSAVAAGSLTPKILADELYQLFVHPQLSGLDVTARDRIRTYLRSGSASLAPVYEQVDDDGTEME